MQPIRISILVALVLLIAAPRMTAANAQETTGSTVPNSPFPPECAARDLQVLAQLDQYGEWREMRGKLANETFWTIMRARQACYDARFAEGLALYDSIHIQSLAGGSAYGVAAPSPPN
jgi:hypothetical protein